MKKITLLLFAFSSLMNAQVHKKNTLVFNPNEYTSQTLTVDGKTFTVRAYEGISYVARPVEKDYQQMNIYIPEGYFEGKSINDFTAETAPIFFPNGIGGYMPAKPLTTNKESVKVALSKGFVVASAGARGRTSATGKAPAAIVDLKAAVRYLRFNDKLIVGNAEKIISNGTSAGGALSTLLGATGNREEFLPYLKALGAADASDDIFAVSAYCPIIDLNNADMAYEWQFNGVNAYKKMEISMLDYNVQRKFVDGTLTEKQIKVSNELKTLYPAYINSYKEIGLTLDVKGEGSFKEAIKQEVIASANKAKEAGTDMSSYNFLTIENEKVTAIDWDKYVRYMGRMKTPPAFDALDLSSGENQLFGDKKTDKKHFTPYAYSHSEVKGKKADQKLVNMMNPLYFIAQGWNKTSHWRLRHGTKDADTSLAVSFLFSRLLEQHIGKPDYALAWDKPHSGDYDLEELFSWAKEKCLMSVIEIKTPKK